MAEVDVGKGDFILLFLVAGLLVTELQYTLRDKHTDADQPGFKSWILLLLAKSLRASDITTLCPSLPIYEMWIIICIYS